MKTMRTYLSGCTWCNAVGLVRNWDNFGMATTPMMKICPVCNGAKTIIVTETIESDLTTHDLSDIDKTDACKQCGHQNEEICNTCTVI